MKHPKSNLFKIIRSRTGFGLATKIPLKKGEFVIEYIGDLIPNKDAAHLTTRYLFEVNSRWTIDGAKRGNVARYINHACKPNCEAEIDGKRVLIYAVKDIPAGTELNYDYGKEYFDEFIKPVGCKCDWHLAKAAKAKAARLDSAKRVKKTASHATKKKTTR